MTPILGPISSPRYFWADLWSPHKHSSHSLQGLGFRVEGCGLKVEGLGVLPHFLDISLYDTVHRNTSLEDGFCKSKTRGTKHVCLNPKP